MDDSTSSVFLKPGTLLGRKYQIIRLIGQGGMGTVYMAYDSSLDLNVAIKVISPDALTGMDEEQREVALKRFQAEARILAKIDHPNVIRILGFNRDTTEYQDRTVEIDYLVMELLAQRTLRDTMEESGFESEEEIREYKPILFDGKKFVVQHPMHAACAVLMVTGYGAQAYAGHYGLRLPEAREWYALKASQPSGNAVRLALPTPVINYSKNRFGIRGINEIAEWGKNREGSFVVLGRSSSTMIESELVSVKDPDKYYTDTSFRVARDVDLDKVPKQSR
jgi:hypothetical protein